MLAEPLLDQVIRPEPALAGAAVNQRVIEALDVPRRLPNARMHQNAGIETDDVPALMHEPAPPQVLDVAFELDSQAAHSPRYLPDRRKCPSLERQIRAACRAR